MPPKIAELARKFKVPYERLKRRNRGLPSKSTRLHTSTKLTNVQEEAILLYLRRCEEIGLQPRLYTLRATANSVLKQAHQNPLTPPPTVSKMWPLRFRERHPQLFTKRAIPLDASRAAAHNIDEIQGWFNRLLEVKVKHGFHPSDIWNMDETGFRIGIARAQKVLSQNRQAQAYIPAGNNREMVTVIEAISASGRSTPPMIIIAAKTHHDSWHESLHEDTLLGVSDSGYSNDWLALQWLEHFEKYSAPMRTSSHRLLIVDGHESHCTKQFIEYCDSHNIVLFALPPHTTHFLQPLDVGVFQPYKHWHSKALDEAIQNGCIDYKRDDFLADFESFRAKALTITTIRSAFVKTGLEPYQPEIVLSKLRSQLPRPSTPEPYSELQLVTPQSLRTLKRLSDAIVEEPMDPGLKLRLQSILKGGELQAIAGAQAIEQMRNQSAAVKAREKRNSRPRRSLQYGGTLPVSTARLMSQKRAEAELAKAQRAQARSRRPGLQGHIEPIDPALLDGEQAEGS